MDILYMGYFCNEHLFNQLVERGSHSSHARQQLETKLLTGLINEKGENSLEIVSFLPEVSGMRADVEKGEKYLHTDIKYLWCNKKSLFSILKALIKNTKMIKAWAGNKAEKVVITYSTNPIHVIPLFLLRKICQYKVITLCSEVSIFRRTDNIGLLTKISRKISSVLDNGFDGYILLSPYMNEIVNRKQKPYMIMEGIADEERQEERICSHRAILYAGGLTEDNGIKILLEGFVESGCTDVELWICGDGPLEKEIQEYEQKYKNICFFGIVPNSKVQQLEREAMLLISPRFSKNEFTKYSFPSKTIEYMSTGTPTILTKLAGIPEEYFEYVYVLEEETAQGVARLIRNVLDKSDSERMQMGDSAKKFVLSKKNPSVQARRIYDFFNIINDGNVQKWQKRIYE